MGLHYQIVSRIGQEWNATWKIGPQCDQLPKSEHSSIEIRSCKFGRKYPPFLFSSIL